MKKIVPKDAVLIPDDAKRVFEGEIFEVFQWQQKMFDGTSATFEMLRRPDTTIVIPVVGEKIIIIEDDQPHVGPKLSFPGGRVDNDDKDPMSAAVREVREEIGFIPESLRLVSVIQRAVKIEYFVYIYLAADGERTSQTQPDSGEKITLKEIPFAEAKKLVMAGEGYLGDARELFKETESLEDLLNSPNFIGKEVDR